MKRSWLAVPAIVLAAVAFWTSLRLRAQSTATGIVWEYATVEAFTEEIQFTRKISTANICDHTAAGCRWKTIRTSVERSGQSNDALVAATARLGEKGWEAVNTTPGPPNNDKLYF